MSRDSRERRRPASCRTANRAAQVIAWLKVREHCPACGKGCFRRRKDAKKAARLLHPGTHTRQYQCEGYWHFTRMRTKPAWLLPPAQRSLGTAA